MDLSGQRYTPAALYPWFELPVATVKEVVLPGIKPHSCDPQPVILQTELSGLIFNYIFICLTTLPVGYIL
jgi:hypothetical protein